jgi:hypothetical protein
LLYRFLPAPSKVQTKCHSFPPGEPIPLSLFAEGTSINNL